MSADEELPSEVWVVFCTNDSKPICDFVADYKEAAMEHCHRPSGFRASARICSVESRAICA